MTKIKLCGLTRFCDVEFANRLLPEFVGFVFAPKSKRYVSPEFAAGLREKLDARIQAVGVFADEEAETVAELVRRCVVDVVQLHGAESERYLAVLRKMIDRPMIQAFRVESRNDVERANRSSADWVLLDSGGGTGKTFDHALLLGIRRPYFLAGGLTPENVGELADRLKPFGVDASSSLETDGVKDLTKMTAFVKAVRKE